ncbi:DNA polymerase III subunit delta' [Hyphomonas sp.]|uniref:DNA polymerase III subunit delta' n=1 Tax=Hyphomonas sp. TaxID=87 RepID=UPI00391D691E
MTPVLPLYGHDRAEAAFLAALSSGRMHHAWLVEGPSGIGKARFALRLAAYLLGARGPASAPLDAPADDTVMRRVLAGSHPDLSLKKREPNDKGKLAQDITVEQARELTQFFTLKPAMGGWRIGIVDAMDEANRNAANALLKTLEEPPPQCLLILLNHGTQPLLPTIRSRCRTLRLSPLNEADSARAMEAAGIPADAAMLARGRPGLALRLSAPAALSAASAARAFVKALPRADDRTVTAALSAASAGPDAQEAFRTVVLDWVAVRAAQDMRAAGVWLRLARLCGEAETLNMDAAQVSAKLIAGVQEAAKSG